MLRRILLGTGLAILLITGFPETQQAWAGPGCPVCIPGPTGNALDAWKRQANMACNIAGAFACDNATVPGSICWLNEVVRVIRNVIEHTGDRIPQFVVCGFGGCRGGGSFTVGGITILMVAATLLFLMAKLIINLFQTAATRNQEGTKDILHAGGRIMIAWFAILLLGAGGATVIWSLLGQLASIGAAFGGGVASTVQNTTGSANMCTLAWAAPTGLGNMGISPWDGFFGQLQTLSQRVLDIGGMLLGVSWTLMPDRELAGAAGLAKLIPVPIVNKLPMIIVTVRLLIALFLAGAVISMVIGFLVTVMEAIVNVLFLMAVLPLAIMIWPFQRTPQALPAILSGFAYVSILLAVVGITIAIASAVFESILIYFTQATATAAAPAYSGGSVIDAFRHYLDLIYNSTRNTPLTIATSTSFGIILPIFVLIAGIMLIQALFRFGTAMASEFTGGSPVGQAAQGIQGRLSGMGSRLGGKASGLLRLGK